MLYLHGLGHYHPNNIIDNSFLESLNINTNNEWILDRVGIHERRTALPLNYIRETYNKNPTLAFQQMETSYADGAARAVHHALSRAGIETNQVGLVVAGECILQYPFPANASVIAAAAGIQSMAIDINTACSSFATQMHYLNHLDESILPEYIVVVNPGFFTSIIDFTDRNTAVLFGDGAAAAVVSKRHESAWRLMDSHVDSNPKEWPVVTSPTGGHFSQQGSRVQHFAIKTTVSEINYLSKRNAVNLNEIYFIGHQANLMMLQSAASRAGIAPEKHFYNVDRFGNCGAASAPSVFSQRWDSFKSNDQVLMSVVGAGLTWGSLLFKHL